MSLKTAARTLLRWAFRIGLFFIMLLVIGVVLVRWDTNKLRGFCEEVKPGTPVLSIRQIAEQHGIHTHWLKGDGVLDQASGEWRYYVPSNLSGRSVCAIRHDRETIISSAMEFD